MIYLITYLTGLLFTFTAAYLTSDNDGEEVKEPYRTAVCLSMATLWPALWLFITVVLIFKGDDDE